MVRFVQGRIACDRMVDSVFQGHWVAILIVKLIKNLFDNWSSVVFVHSSCLSALPSNFVDLLLFSKVFPLSLMEILEEIVFDSDCLIEKVLIVNVRGC